MAKKTFTFATHTQDHQAGQISQTGREVLRKTRDDGVLAMDNAKLVRVDRLVPDPGQPRKSIDPQYLSRLAESIRRYGVLSPITVKYRVQDETFLIIAGEQRWRAAQQAGLAEVPVVVRNSSTTDRYVESCMENLVRADLTEIEKGEALEELKRLLPQTWEDIAAMLGLTRRRVDQMRQLTAMSEPLQNAVRARSISGRHARKIDLLPPPLKEPVLQAVVDHDLTVRQVEEMVRLLRENSAPQSVTAGEAEKASIAGVLTGADDGEDDGESRAHPTAMPAQQAEGVQVAAVIAAVLEGDAVSPRQRHSVPVVKKLMIIEKSLRGIPLHSVGNEDRVEVLARLGSIHEVLAQMERVLG